MPIVAALRVITEGSSEGSSLGSSLNYDRSCIDIKWELNEIILSRFYNVFIIVCYSFIVLLLFTAIGRFFNSES